MMNMHFDVVDINISNIIITFFDVNMPTAVRKNITRNINNTRKN